MKHFKITAAKKVVATVVIDGSVFNALGGAYPDGIAPFLKEHPEYNECHYDTSWKGDDCIYTFFSIGNPVVEEV